MHVRTRRARRRQHAGMPLAAKRNEPKTAPKLHVRTRATAGRPGTKRTQAPVFARTNSKKSCKSPTDFTTAALEPSALCPRAPSRHRLVTARALTDDHPAPPLGVMGRLLNVTYQSPTTPLRHRGDRPVRRAADRAGIGAVGRGVVGCRSRAARAMVPAVAEGAGGRSAPAAGCYRPDRFACWSQRPPRMPPAAVGRERRCWTS